MIKKKKLKGYATLKEARKVARELAKYMPVPIYLESDGSYTVMNPNDKKAVFCVAIDKSGARYKVEMVYSYTGKKVDQYIKI